MLGALAAESRIESIVGVCRRLPSRQFAKVEWRSADVVTSPLDELFEGADAVVHLAWAIQPARDRETVRAINVDGSRRVFAAVAAAGVPALVYASSVGAYAPGPKDRRVDESWPTTGIPTSFYSTHKAEVERLLDRFEVDHPEVRCVRAAAGLGLQARGRIGGTPPVCRAAAAGGVGPPLADSRGAGHQEAGCAGRTWR